MLTDIVNQVWWAVTHLATLKPAIIDEDRALRELEWANYHYHTLLVLGPKISPYAYVRDNQWKKRGAYFD